MNKSYLQKVTLSAFVVLTFMMILVMTGCKRADAPYQQLTGKYLDKNYDIRYKNDSVGLITKGIDSIIRQISGQLDVKNPSSTISRFNNANDTFFIDPTTDSHFLALWNYSKIFLTTSQGILDPSMAPLFGFYGDGYDKRKSLSKNDTVTIAQLFLLKSFSSLSLQTTVSRSYIFKPDKGITVNFAAIQTGYVVDRIATYLDTKQIRNYYIDIDGKCHAKGISENKMDWTYGINRPKSSAQNINQELPLIISNKGIATSGSYTNAKESTGNKYAFIVDPKTGYSRLSDVLSVTVIADDCITADAYATAFVTLGLVKSIELIKQLKGVGACFIYDIEGDGNFEFQISEGFSKNYLHNEQQ